MQGAFKWGIRALLASLLLLIGTLTTSLIAPEPPVSAATVVQTIGSFYDSSSISSDGTHVWVANYQGNSVTEINASTGAIVQTINVGSSPQSISSDGTHVWVANSGGNSVTELNASTGAIVQTINVGSEPGAISSDGTYVWVANSGGNSVTELNALTGAVVQTVNVGSSPSGISSDGTHVWVANDLSNSVTELNALTGAVVQTVNVGSNPSGISSDGTHVWVANSQGNEGNSVTELNASTGAVVQTINVGSEPGAVSSDGTFVWVANSGSDSVTELDTSTGAVIKTIAIGAESVGVSSDGTHVWVANFSNSSVTELVASTGTLVQTFGLFSQPQDISSDGTNVWVANGSDDSVVELDASTGAVVRTINVGSYLFGISSDGAHVWVTNLSNNSVTEITASTGTIVQTINVGNGPKGISSDGTHVWVANSGGNSVTELNASTGAIVQTINVGSNPQSISSDGTHVWVANSGGNSVTELNASTGAVVQTINVSRYPDGISSDGTHVWVANYQTNSVTEINASTGAVVQTLGLYSSPLAISSDGIHVWVAGYNSTSVTELNALTGAVVQTLGFGNYIADISSDGSNVWVVSGNYVTQIAIGNLSASTPIISDLPSAGYVGGNFTATVSTNGDGALSVTSSTSSVCTMSGLVVSYIGAGTCTLTAHVATGATFGASDGTPQSISVVQPAATASQPSGWAGTAISISGSKWPPSASGTLKFTVGSDVGTASVDASGNLTGTISVGSTEPLGSNPIIATVGSTTVSIPFTVTPVPTADASATPGSASSGAAVSISGSNWSPTGPQVAIHFTSGGDESGTTVNPDGSISANIVVGSSETLGSNPIIVTQGTESVTIPFSVTASASAPSLTLSASSGAPGSVVAVTGANWPTTGALSTSFQVGPDFGTVSVSPAGVLSGSITVGTLEPTGYNPVVVFDGSTFASAAFTVSGPPGTPTLSLSPTEGGAGTTIMLSGHDWNPTGGATVWFAYGTDKGTASIDASGNLTGSITVTGAESLGVNPVVAAQGSTMVSSSFTVTTSSATAPTAFASPSQGGIGTVVSLTGQNWDPNGGPVSVRFTTGTDTGSASISSSGVLSGSITVGLEEAFGSNPIVITQGSTSVNVSAGVLPEATGGTTTSVGGYDPGLPSGSSVTVSIPGGGSCTTTVDSNGNYSCPISIPTTPGPTYITVTDGSITFTIPFTVLSPSISGGTVTLGKSTGLLGHYAEKVSGTGWNAHGDTSVTLFQCASSSFSPSTCDNTNKTAVTLGTGRQAGTFKNAIVSLAVGTTDSDNDTCGLAASHPCFIVAIGNTGDVTTSTSLTFTSPLFYAKKIKGGVLGNEVDPLKTTGFPMGDSILAEECESGANPTTTNLATNCDVATQITGTVAVNGKVVFTSPGVKLLVGGSYSDSSGGSCVPGGSCQIALVDEDNPTIPTIAPSSMIMFATPSGGIAKSSGVAANYIDKVTAINYPIGDTISAQECDSGANPTTNLATNCDAATQITGTVAANGKVVFTSPGVKLLVGGSYSDSSGGSCVPGGSCQIALVDEDNPSIATADVVVFATPYAALAKSSGVGANYLDKVTATNFPIGDTISVLECDSTVNPAINLATNCDAATRITGTMGSNGNVLFSPATIPMKVGTSYIESGTGSVSLGGMADIVVSDSTASGISVVIPITLAP
jgi:YVTN family beta-propeller protein